MEKDQIKNYDVLRNPKASFCGFVSEIGKNVTLKDLKLNTITFDPSYLEPATDEDRKLFRDVIEKARIDDKGSARKAVTADKSSEEIRAGLNKFVTDMAVKSPEAAEQFKAFWAEVIAVVGDAPGKTWDMRWKSVKNFCPVLKAPSKLTNDWVAFFYLLVGRDVRLEIKKDYLPEQFAPLFPILNKMMGTTNAVKTDWPAFNTKKGEYLELLKVVHAHAAEPAVAQVQA
jgi:hypothetical protein